MTISCFQWFRPQTSGRSGFSWCAISLYPKGHSFTKLLFIVFLILSHFSHSWRIAKVFYLFFLFFALYSCDFHCLLVSIHFYVIFVQGVSVCVSAGTHKHIQSTTSGGGSCLAPHLIQAVLLVACTAGSRPARACEFSNPAFPLPEKCWDSRRASPHPAYMWAVGSELRASCLWQILYPLSHLLIPGQHSFLFLIFHI